MNELSKLPIRIAIAASIFLGDGVTALGANIEPVNTSPSPQIVVPTDVVFPTDLSGILPSLSDKKPPKIEPTPTPTLIPTTELKFSPKNQIEEMAVSFAMAYFQRDSQTMEDLLHTTHKVKEDAKESFENLVRDYNKDWKATSAGGIHVTDNEYLKGGKKAVVFFMQKNSFKEEPAEIVILLEKDTDGTYRPTDFYFGEENDPAEEFYLTKGN